MCGIAGIIDFKQSFGGDKLTQSLQAMSSKIEHRGPDDQGIWISASNKLGFAHRRLSIVDLGASGHQPMQSHDERFTLTFNGEIYNYQELREELITQGVEFLTSSDSEVLIECYRAYGKRCLERFDGMFAFVIYDSLEESYFCARDAFGEKPFYYAWVNGAFVFASEMSAIAALEDFKSITDLEAVASFLCLQYVSGEEAFYQGVKKLAPGHSLSIDAEGVVVQQRYFEFCPGKKSHASEAELLDELEDILLRNIKKRFRADVPVGAFLSGGLDSSLVVALATKKLGLDVQTFTIGFADWPDSEHLIARETATYLGTRHTEQILQPECYELFDDIASRVDEPNGDTSLLPTFLLSRLARQHCKVVLSGDGADELFGGYGRYFSTLAEAKNADNFKLGHAYYSHKILTFTEVDLFSLLQKLPQETCTKLNDLREGLNSAELSKIDRLRKTDVENYLPGAVLAKVDRMSMQNGLEVRTPFLNVELARFVEKLPEKYLADEHGGKYLLKKLAARYLPDALINRPKKGFGIPQSLWGEDVLLAQSEKRLLGQSAFRSWWLKQDGIKPWLAHGKKHGAAEIYKLWSIYHLDKFLEVNHVASIDTTNPVHTWMLEKKLLEQKQSTLVLSIFPVGFESQELTESCTHVSTWKSSGKKLRYSRDSDWLSDFQTVYENANNAAKCDIKCIALIGVNSAQLYKNADFLRSQSLKRVLIFEDSMWQAHSLKPKGGWRSEINKLYPALFSISEKSFEALSAKSLSQDLLFFLRSTFTPFIEGKHEDPFLKQDRRLLLDRKSPLRAYALLREGFYAAKHVFKERQHFQKLAQQVAKAYVRSNPEQNKIIFVLPSLYSGGAERQACNLMVSLAQRGKEVSLLSLSPLVGSSAHYLPLIESSGIKIIDMSERYQGVDFEGLKQSVPSESLSLLAYDKPLVQRQLWPVFYRLYSENPAQVVCFLDTPNLIGGIAALLAGVPRVVTSFRNINPSSFAFYERWYDPYYNALVKSPSLVMTGNSLGGNESYAQWLGLPNEQLKLLRNGIDFAHFEEVSDAQISVAQRRLNFDEGAPVVGGVFRLSEEKRPELFIKIFARLRELLPSARAYIAGEGPLKSQLERMIANYQLETCLVLLGPVQHVSAFVSLSTVMLQTSRTEGTANSLLEAQYLRVPVVATPGGGVAESFVDGESAWLMKDDDVETIATSLRDILLDRKEIMRRGENGHDFVMENFSLDNSVEQLLSYCQ